MVSDKDTSTELYPLIYSFKVEFSHLKFQQHINLKHEKREKKK